MPKRDTIELIHAIEPTAVYTEPAARKALGLADNTIRGEVRAGRLRVAERCNRYYFLGAWLLEWIAGGEVRRPSRGRQGAVEGAAQDGKNLDSCHLALPSPVKEDRTS